MDIKNFLQLKNHSRVLYVIAGIIVALIIFQAGQFVGFKKASYSNKWGESYRETFGERGRGMMGIGGNYSTSHGAAGKIVMLELPKIIILGQDNVEKVVVIKDNTLIRSFRDEIKPTDLKVDEYIVAIGTPNETGEVEAKLVRVIPENMINQNTATSSSSESVTPTATNK